MCGLAAHLPSTATHKVLKRQLIAEATTIGAGESLWVREPRGTAYAANPAVPDGESLSLRPRHSPDRFSAGAAGDLVTQLRDVGDLGVQPADGVVQHGEREALFGVSDDAQFAGPLA